MMNGETLLFLDYLNLCGFKKTSNLFKKHVRNNKMGEASNLMFKFYDLITETNLNILSSLSGKFGTDIIKTVLNFVKTKLTIIELRSILSENYTLKKTQNYGEIQVKNFEERCEIYLRMFSLDDSKKIVLSGEHKCYLNHTTIKITNMIHTKSKFGESRIPLRDGEYVVCYYSYDFKSENEFLSSCIYLTSFGNIKIHIDREAEFLCGNLDPLMFLYQDNYFRFKEEFNKLLANDHIFILKSYFTMSLNYANLSKIDLAMINMFIGIKSVIVFMKTFHQSEPLSLKSDDSNKRLDEVKNIRKKNNEKMRRIVAKENALASKSKQKEIADLTLNLRDKIKKYEDYSKSVRLYEVKLKLREENVIKKEELLKDIELPVDIEPGEI